MRIPNRLMGSRKCGANAGTVGAMQIQSISFSWMLGFAGVPRHISRRGATLSDKTVQLVCGVSCKRDPISSAIFLSLISPDSKATAIPGALQLTAKSYWRRDVQGSSRPTRRVTKSMAGLKLSASSSITAGETCAAAEVSPFPAYCSRRFCASFGGGVWSS